MSSSSFLVYDSQLFSALIYFNIKNMSSKHPRSEQQLQSCERVVTIIRDDGQEFIYSFDLYVEEFLQEHPGHAVCHAKTLLHKRLCKVLCPITHLMRGEYYLMLSMYRDQPKAPLPASQAARTVVEQSRTSKIASESTTGLETNPIGGGQQGPLIPRKFVITRQQLGNILGEGSSDFNKTNETAAQTSQAITPQGLQVHLNKSRPANMPTFFMSHALSRRRITMRWSPKLPSIPEMPMPGNPRGRRRYGGFSGLGQYI